MSATIFLAGILQFQSKERFEEALEALRTEETYVEAHSLVPVLQAARISDTLLVLRHTSTLPASLYDRLMAEAYLLSEFAGRGYIAGIVHDAKPRVQVAMAAMTYPVIDSYKRLPDPEPGTDYLPRLPNTQLEYSYRSEGRDTTIAWTARSSPIGQYVYISFPTLGSEDPFNDWWDGHYYLKAGPQWFSVTTDLDVQALSDPAEEEIQLIMDGDAQPGQTYFSYVPGTESFRLYTHEGYEDVQTPYGEFERCMKVRVDLYFLPTDEQRYTGHEADRAFKRVTTTHYFGRGAGLVRLVFEGGELELTGMKPVEDAGIPHAPLPSESSGTGLASNPDRKPWWKFW